MASPQIVDSHLHLQDYEPGTDVRGIAERAAAAGVSRLVCNGTSERDWPEVLEMARTLPGVIPCLGLHPWFVRERSEHWLSTLEKTVEENACGVGEIGLDRCVEEFDADAQEQAFRAQLSIARKHRRPAMVHCVRAWGWMMDVLRDEDELPAGVLIHAYGGSADLVGPLAEMGAYFTFAGNVLKEHFAKAREALRAVPRDRLLVESDAPNMLPPEEFRTDVVVSADGREFNSPANLPSIAAGIADLLGESREELIQRLWENSRAFLAPIVDTNGKA